MKKFLAVLLILGLLFSAVGCENAQNPTDERPVNGNPAVIEPDVADDTMGANLWEAFQEALVSNANETPGVIARTIIEDESIFPYSGDVMAVEPGLLNGFDNAEITGFEEGVVFMPIISVIPFIGYIFRLPVDADAEAFLATLENNCNTRWNISTQAEQIVAGAYGNTVLFVMCPESPDGAF